MGAQYPPNVNCPRCNAALDAYWPYANAADRFALLIGATGFPLVDCETVRRQLKEAADETDWTVRQACARFDDLVEQDLRAVIAKAP